MRTELSNPDLKSAYRKNPQAFSRNRKLNFSTVFTLILQKSVKSLRVRLNEFFDHVQEATVTASAFTQARANLSHEIFIDLNRKAYGVHWYTSGKYETYKGYRLLAIDGSKIRLPDSDSVRREFGSIRIENQHITGSYTGGQSSVLYDPLNDLALDSILAPGSTGELELALKHLELCTDGDLCLLDRGYPGYELFATFAKKKVDFVCRCSTNAFGVVEGFIKQKKVLDSIVTITPCKDVKAKVHTKGLPSSLQIRLLKVELATGETEILATSLCDRQRHPIQDFLELYAMRWGVETFFDRLKNRLALEHFSGKTAEAVKQDFYATILISNIESEITAPVNNQLKASAKKQYHHKVDRTVSFSTIKNKAVELLFSLDEHNDIILEELQKLFQKNTIPIRPQRTFSRKTSIRRALHFHKRKKKVVF